MRFLFLFLFAISCSKEKDVRLKGIAENQDIVILNIEKPTLFINDKEMHNQYLMLEWCKIQIQECFNIYSHEIENVNNEEKNKGFITYIVTIAFHIATGTGSDLRPSINRTKEEQLKIISIPTGEYYLKSIYWHYGLARNQVKYFSFQYNKNESSQNITFNIKDNMVNLGSIKIKNAVKEIFYRSQSII